MPSNYVDILVVTDARLVGGGNKSLAQEIVAQSAAGYTTGLLSLAGPARGGARPLDDSLMRLIDDGRLILLRPDSQIEANLVIARGPSMFGVEQPFVPKVRAEKWLLVANAFNTSSEVSSLLYDPHLVAVQAEKMFGHQWSWVPLSPVVRQKMLAAHPKLELSPLTWSNIINLDDWTIDRPERLVRPIRIGRHSRDAPGKWPTTEQAINDAYPSGEDFRVSIMGGVRTPQKVLGGTPKNWEVYKFGAMPPREFLRQVDIYPYYHHPSMHEAFGRAVLEAIASGAIAVLPSYFESIFSDAALYRPPSGVIPLAHRLADDPVYLRERREIAKSSLEQKFSYRSHIERLKNIIGPPRGTLAPVSGSVPKLREFITDKPRVLFYTDNGHGLGHVTRLLAYAKRIGPEVQSYFLTMSEAYRLVHEQNYPVEYFPSAKKLKFSAKQKPAWEQILNVRIREMLDRIKPMVLVVDHVNPPEVLHSIRADYPNTKFIWSRRGLWRQQRKPGGLYMSDAFDYVLEPMDLAAATDMGFTPRLSDGTLYVPPITLVQRDELLSREQARAELGLPATGTSVLLNLSADTSAELVALLTYVQRLLRSNIRADESLTIFAPRHALHVGALKGVEDIIMRPVYPIAKYANAFDAAISTAGYNSYHELVHLGVPSVFVARATQTLDDQNRRASFAPLAGYGASAQTVYSPEFEAGIRSIMDPRIRARMRACAAEVFPENGAVRAAHIIERLAQGKSPLEVPQDLAEPAVDSNVDMKSLRLMKTQAAVNDSGSTVEKALEQMPSGIYLPPNAVRDSSRIIVDATQYSAEELSELTNKFAYAQLKYPFIKPIFLISALNPTVLSEAGFIYETVMPQTAWGRLGTGVPYAEYIARRFHEMVKVFRAHKMGRINPGEVIPRWMYER